MAGIIPPQEFSFFMDESGLSNRYTVVGGLCLRSARIPEVHASLQRFRETHNMRGELKWTKVTDQKVEQYRAFFALNNINALQFHAIVFDNHRANNKRYNDGDDDKALSKLYYELMVHRFGRRCGPYGDLCVCVDQRNSSTSLSDLRRMANTSLARDYGVVNNPIRQILPQDSKVDDILQLNDVILGAVCAARNGRHLLAGGRQSKVELARSVLEASGLGSFDVDSPRRVKRFTIWNLRMLPR
jgi:hypothetical protein